jgi:hypothetical protein
MLYSVRDEERIQSCKEVGIDPRNAANLTTIGEENSEPRNNGGETE